MNLDLVICDPTQPAGHENKNREKPFYGHKVFILTHIWMSIVHGKWVFLIKSLNYIALSYGSLLWITTMANHYERSFKRLEY